MNHATSPETLEEVRALQQQITEQQAEIARLTHGGEVTLTASGGRFIVSDVPAFVHCADPFCAGMETQRPVTAQSEVRIETYGDRGGDGSYANLTENQSERLFFRNPDEYVCGECGKPTLEISRQPRPQYRHVSGHAQDALLKQLRSGVSAEEVVAAAMKERADRGPQEREMAAVIERMTAEMAQLRADIEPNEDPKVD